MNETTSHAEQVGTIPQTECWDLVQRILASRHLLKAPQLREILLYIGRRGLWEGATAISEQEIGCQALGRRADFSPNEDNIVRVQVRHLRRKLEEYFAAEGAGERLLLTIPKGAYVPRFELRMEAEAAAAVESPEHLAGRNAASAGLALKDSATRSGRVAAEILNIPVAPGRVGARPRKIAAAAVGLLVVGLGTALLWRHSPVLVPASQVARPGAADPLWSRIFQAGQTTNIVLADSSLAAIQDVLHADIPLSDYLTGAYPEKLIAGVTDPQLRAALELVAGRQYTSLADAALASKLMESSRRYSAQAGIRYSRFLSARDFKMGNFILVGSRRGIPWAQLFEPQLNFSLERDGGRHAFFFRNKAPQGDEAPEYRAAGGADPETYADIALLPNLSGTGSVLILAGIDMAGTEAAGELVLSAEFSDVLSKMLGPRRGQSQPSYIEMLMQAKAVAGTTHAPKIVAYRLVQDRPLSAASAAGGADIQ